MSRQQRRVQLLEVARELIRAAGTEEFTLGRLAERAGVTKPVVYDHFGDKSGALAELYREFDVHQRETLAAALQDAADDLSAVAHVVAAAYIDCCVAEGREMADVVAALEGSPTLSRLRCEAEDAYLEVCREALSRFCGPVNTAGLRAIIGAGDALVRDVLADRITTTDAHETLARVVAAVATYPANDPAKNPANQEDRR
ncbi:TetR family transcriptional regulator [Mycolicibacterium goodii]|uniref:TetR family transcriptional regulator n=2 Tax=Mycolicibacterium goodii TaxID=134601 RepID=A0A0K0X3D1_MYCGD|nr:TetR family transcriptional regulator [Mycolicibacterium goodii]